MRTGACRLRLARQFVESYNVNAVDRLESQLLPHIYDLGLPTSRAVAVVIQAEPQGARTFLPLLLSAKLQVTVEQKQKARIPPE